MGGQEYSGKEGDTLRICNHCLGMLENRRRVQNDQMIKPKVWHLYLLLQNNKKDIQTSVDMYNKVINIVNQCYVYFVT